MKKKIVSALLLSAMLVGMCAASPISAADDEEVLGTPKKSAVTLSEAEPNAKTAPKDLPKDVEKADDKWYFGAMKTTYNMGIINGNLQPDGTVSWDPDDDASRAMIVKIIRRYAGVSDEEIKDKSKSDAFPFTDVDALHWAIDDIAWAAELGIVKGRTDTTFEPEGNITRCELAAMLVRAADKLDSIDISNQEAIVDKFEDVADNWASSEKEGNVLDKARAHGIIKGKVTTEDGKNYFYPDDNVSRAEVATMITRYDMDPMYYVVSNLGEYLATRDTRPLLQFSNSQEFGIEAMNNIILPQVGLDPAKYTVVLPEYQMRRMTDNEENDYKKPRLDKETGIQKTDEKGELLFSNDGCGCGSFYGDCGFSGAGGGTDPNSNQLVLKPWFAIKNTNGTEDTSDDVTTQYVLYEWTVIKMDTSAENDWAYTGLKGLSSNLRTAYTRNLDANSLANIVLQAAGINETYVTNGKTTPSGYAYSVDIPEAQVEAALNAFSTLEDQEEVTVKIKATIQNKATFKDSVTNEFDIVLVKDKFAGAPSVE